jgi:hypothetical protein
VSAQNGEFVKLSGEQRQVFAKSHSGHARRHGPKLAAYFSRRAGLWIERVNVAWAVG